MRTFPECLILWLISATISCGVYHEAKVDPTHSCVEQIRRSKISHPNKNCKYYLYFTYLGKTSHFLIPDPSHTHQPHEEAIVVCCTYKFTIMYNNIYSMLDHVCIHTLILQTETMETTVQSTYPFKPILCSIQTIFTKQCCNVVLLSLVNVKEDTEISEEALLSLPALKEVTYTDKNVASQCRSAPFSFVLLFVMCIYFPLAISLDLPSL